MCLWGSKVTENMLYWCYFDEEGLAFTGMAQNNIRGVITGPVLSSGPGLKK